MFQVNPLLIHMKNQALFSLKDKSKKLKCCQLQFLIGALRVNPIKCPEGIGFFEMGVLCTALSVLHPPLSKTSK